MPNGLLYKKGVDLSERCIIGLCGPMGAGKSTAAKWLASEYGLQVRPFAEPLKRMVAALGVPAEHIYGTPEQKSEPLAMLCGQTARHAMQTLGTEWGRHQIGDDLWERIWCNSVARSGYRAVADDVRFPNEVDAVKRCGGFVICIVRDVRDALMPATGHASENFQVLAYDELIVNDGTEHELHVQLQDALLNARRARRAEDRLSAAE